MTSTRDERTRGALEIITAVLLGLVSVATAFGAYQAGQWAQQASDLASVSQQLRDRNLALYLESQNSSRADGEILFDAIALTAEMAFYPERTEQLQAEQDVVLGAATPQLVEAWQAFEDSGFNIDLSPMNAPAYQALTFAPGQSANLISKVAYDSSEVLEDRSYTMTIVSVVFALALLLLGVAGVSDRLNVSAIMTGAGAVAFLVGVAIVIFGIF